MKPTEFFKKIVASMRSQGLPEDRGLALDNTQALWDYLRADEPVKEERYLKWSDALKLVSTVWFHFTPQPKLGTNAESRGVKT